MPVRPPTFRPTGSASQPDAKREYDHLRGSARKRGYTSSWDRAALAFKAEHPICLGCLAVGDVEPSTTVDHIQPHRGDDALMWDRANWQSCCTWHHNVVKQLLESRHGRGEISVGELRLDSSAAVALTRSLRRGGGGV